MKDILKNAAKVFGIKIAVSFIFVAFMLSFTWLFDYSIGYMLYSVLGIVILLSWLFSVFNAEGRKLSVKNKYMGVIYGAVCEIISLLLVLAMLLFKSSFKPLNILYWILNAPFSGFFGADAKLFLMTNMSPGYILPIITIPLICGIGYYFGYNKYEFGGNLLNKLVYKDEEGEAYEKEK